MACLTTMNQIVGKLGTITMSAGRYGVSSRITRYHLSDFNSSYHQPRYLCLHHLHGELEFERAAIAWHLRVVIEFLGKENIVEALVRLPLLANDAIGPRLAQLLLGPDTSNGN